MLCSECAQSYNSYYTFKLKTILIFNIYQTKSFLKKDLKLIIFSLWEIMSAPVTESGN